MSEPSISVEIDQVAECAYVRFSRNAVVETEELDDAINIDLDEHGMVVGVELLDLSCSIPFDLIAKRVHISSAHHALLTTIARNQATPVLASGAAARRKPRGVRATPDLATA